MRQRIVISLEQPGANKPAHGSNKGRGWPKVLLLLGLLTSFIILIVAGAAFFWWRHYQKTPAYSLAIFVDACQRQDGAVIDQALDIDKILEGFANPVIEKASNRYGGLLQPAVTERVRTVVTNLLPQVKPLVREALITRVQELSKRAQNWPFIVIAFGLPYHVDIKTEGDIAKVTTTSGEQPINLTLQSVGERWKIIEVKDDGIVPRVVDEIIPELPAIGELGQGFGNPDKLLTGRMRNPKKKGRR